MVARSKEKVLGILTLDGISPVSNVLCSVCTAVQGITLFEQSWTTQLAGSFRLFTNEQGAVLDSERFHKMIVESSEKYDDGDCTMSRLNVEFLKRHL